jgi:hypothetical protein
MERLSPAPQLDRRAVPAPPEAPPSPNGRQNSEPPPHYPTGLGPLTFDQLYHQTSRAVGYVMRETLGMTNPQDIDDCMQSGYLKLWQKLQADPAWLADKPRGYIVQAVVLRSKAQRYSHLRYYRKLVYDAQPALAEGHRQLTTERVDTWMDIAQALHTVSHAVEEDPLMLLSLYTFITQAKATEVSQVFGVNYKTLAKRRPQTRALLAGQLAAYRPAGTPAENGSQAAIPHPPAAKAPLVSPWLLEDKPALWPAVEPAAPERLEPHYPTGWGGPLTLEQILTHPVVQRAAFVKAGRLGLNRDDQDDCIQRGSIRLWQALQADPTLLADKAPQWVGLYLAYRGDPKHFHRHNRRQRTFRDPAFDWPVADEYLPLGSRSAPEPSHATWATEVDESLDVRRFMDTLMQHYAANPRQQIALQAVMGTISSQEAARQLGLHQKNFAASLGNLVRQEVQARLPETLKPAQIESWQAQLARGEGVDHVAQIAQEVMHNQRLLLALYVVTTSASKKAVARTFGYGLTAFGRDIRQIKQLIAERYRRQRLRPK